MSAGAVPAADLVTLCWVVPNEHSRTFDLQEWVEFVGSLDSELDPNDFDAVYNYFEDSRRDGPEVLMDMATERTWVDCDTSRVEIRDLFRVIP